MAKVTMGLPLSSSDSASRAMGPPETSKRAVSSLGSL